MNTETKTLETALQEYLKKLQDHSDSRFKTDYPNTWELGQAPKFIHSTGKRWIKIISDAPGSHSLFCFIDPANGDIYKGAGWNAPAKGKRGNIFNENLPLTLGSLYR